MSSFFGAGDTGIGARGPSLPLPGGSGNIFHHKHTDWKNLAQKSGLSQKAVALPLLIHRRARAGVFGIKGCWSLSMTGTNIGAISPFRVYYIPFAADPRRGARLGRRLARSVGMLSFEGQSATAICSYCILFCLRRDV